MNTNRESWPGPGLGNAMQGPRPVNEFFTVRVGKHTLGARVCKHKSGPGSVNTNWGTGPVNTNWRRGPGPEAKQRAGTGKYKHHLEFNNFHIKAPFLYKSDKNSKAEACLEPN